MIFETLWLEGFGCFFALDIQEPYYLSTRTARPCSTSVSRILETFPPATFQMTAQTSTTSAPFSVPNWEITAMCFPPTATCHVWCCVTKTMVRHLGMVSTCWWHYSLSNHVGIERLDLVSRGINQFYVYVYISGIPGVPQLYVGNNLFTKWHTSMSKAWMNRTAVTSEPCNSQERRYSCKLLRPNATVQFLWHDW